MIKDDGTLSLDSVRDVDVIKEYMDSTPLDKKISAVELLTEFMLAEPALSQALLTPAMTDPHADEETQVKQALYGLFVYNVLTGIYRAERTVQKRREQQAVQ